MELLSCLGKVVDGSWRNPSSGGKNENVNIYSSANPIADEHLILLKASEQLLNGPWGCLTGLKFALLS